jgi:hypothetical protein
MLVPALDEVQRHVARGGAVDAAVNVLPRHAGLLLPVEQVVERAQDAFFGAAAAVDLRGEDRKKKVYEQRKEYANKEY